MCQLVKQIAPNIDDLLQRYNQSDCINAIAQVSNQQSQQLSTATNSDVPVNTIIRRIEKLEEDNRFFRKSRGGKFRNKKKVKNLKASVLTVQS